MNPRRKLPGLQLAVVLAAVPLALAAALPSVHQPRTPGASSRQGSRILIAWNGRQVSSAASPIKHVVVLYMENHTFDNMLGFWCNKHPGRCPDGGMPPSVTLSDGTVVTPSKTPDRVPRIRHQTVDQQTAIDGGKMDGWGNIPGCGAIKNYACISGYQPQQVPNITRLAQAFSISDETFTMQNSPSWFGHLYAVAATTDGFTGNNPPIGGHPGQGWGCDSGKKTTWVSGGISHKVPSCIPDPSLIGPGGTPLVNGGASAPTPVPYVPTIMDRLNAAKLPWHIYGAQCTKENVNSQGLETCSQTTGTYLYSICPSFAECLYSQSSGLVSDQRFFADAHAGKLPAFSVVLPGDATQSEHNQYFITPGDNWLGDVASAVMNSPEWSSTALFITWDDCGCFYDQVHPGRNPDGTPRGPRVPLVIVSPFAKPGFTDRTPTTFAGILAFTEHTFGLPALKVNDARAYDFADAFNFAQRPLTPVRMVTRPLPIAARHIRVTPALANDPT
jgi:phospholipase C